jgi:hypothetical protein
LEISLAAAEYCLVVLIGESHLNLFPRLDSLLSMKMERKIPEPKKIDYNEIDHILRRDYGIVTVAQEMDREVMERAKCTRSPKQHLEDLSRKIGDLRAELAFYRDCFRYAEGFKNVMSELSKGLAYQHSELSKELLEQRILSILDGADGHFYLQDGSRQSNQGIDSAIVGEIEKISTAMTVALETLANQQQQAFGRFVVPYRRRPLSHPIFHQNGDL